MYRKLQDQHKECCVYNTNHQLHIATLCLLATIIFIVTKIFELTHQTAKFMKAFKVSPYKTYH